MLLKIFRLAALMAFSGLFYAVLAAPQALASCSQCPVPAAESSDPYGQSSNKAYVLEYFEQTLLNPSSDPTGHTVDETYGSPGSNACWFNGSYLSGNPEDIKISGGSWVVTSSYQWGPDEIGLSDQDAEQIWGAYVDGMVSLPCTVTTYQNMEIECDSSLFWEYESDVVQTRTVDASAALKVCRASNCGAEIPIS